MPERRICAVTGSRADYGLLEPVMRAVAATPGLRLQVVATGMHLSADHGDTWRAIEADGFKLDARVESLVADDSALGTAQSIGKGVAGMAAAYAKLQPDLVLLLGDRYEIFAAAQAALVALLPIAHIAGGDLTEGAYDDAMRHGITKMAQLHFATHADAGRRLRQLGEDPARIHVVGSPGIDALLKVRALQGAELERGLGFKLRARNLLVTYHPATLEGAANGAHFDALAAALAGLGPDVGLLFSYPNADTGGREIAQRIDAFVSGRANARAYRSLNRELYVSCMRACSAMVGNSSSGLYEAPSVGLPAVNVGDRQKGRVRAASVIDCAPEAGAIAAAIGRAFALGRPNVENPYGDGQSAPRIAAILGSITDYRALLKKRFHDWAGK